MQSRCVLGDVALQLEPARSFKSKRSVCYSRKVVSMCSYTLYSFVIYMHKNIHLPESDCDVFFSTQFASRSLHEALKQKRNVCCSIEVIWYVEHFVCLEIQLTSCDLHTTRKSTFIQRLSILLVCRYVCKSLLFELCMKKRKKKEGMNENQSNFHV